MATERSRQLLLGAIVLVLAFVVYRVWPATSAEEVPASNRTAGTAPAARKQQAAAPPKSPGVNLEALNGDRPKVGAAERNLFRFKPKPPPPPPPPPIQVPSPVTVVNPVPTGPPPPPALAPIALKFIGLMESPNQKQKIAVLSDGRNAPFLGKEGDIIEGRYRILKIGVESIELAYADGRGRQTIRLTGS
jgi:hypothetical protein